MTTIKTRRDKFFKREVILDKLLSAGEVSAEVLLGLFFEALTIADAMTKSPRQAQRALRKNDHSPVKIDLKSKIAFWTLLSKLKKENLISRRRDRKIVITKQGKKYLRTKQKRPFSGKRHEPEKLPDEEIILVIFDIPEEYKRKRDWLRFRLKQFDFKALQKSVWWGDAGLPKEFFKDLKRYKILPYVHVFSVNKKGTISRALNLEN
jgi:hypothetical protein